jgi:bifunctional non-homologous end joining protein LigD
MFFLVRAPASTLPLIDPIRPVLARELPRGRAWCYELKLDGFRGTLYIHRGAAELRSKTQRPMGRFADLAGRVARELKVADAILDGEIVVMDADGPRFDALMFHRGVPQFAAFDLLWLDGRDLRALPYGERKASLRRLIRRQPWVSFVESHAKATLFEAAARMDLEGIVAKRRHDPYAPATRWVKVKNPSYSQNVGRWELFSRRGR